MIFKDIHVYPNLVEYPREVTSRFRYATRPLCNFLERQVLSKLRFQTSYRRLCVVGSKTPSPDVIVNTANVATTMVPFDLARYSLLASVAERQEYYIEMLEGGISRCADQLSLPSDSLVRGLEEFRAGGYRNRWTHAAKAVRSAGVNVELRCEMTEVEFSLTIVFLKDHTSIFEHVILRTSPDELLFRHKFDGLLVVENTLVVTTRNGPPLWTIDLSTIC